MGGKAGWSMLGGEGLWGRCFERARGRVRNLVRFWTDAGLSRELGVGLHLLKGFNRATACVWRC